MIDFDEDGHIDIVEAGLGSATVNVRRGLGSATQAAFADLDHDGHLDMVHVTGVNDNFNADVAIYSGKRDGIGRCAVSRPERRW